MFDIERWQEIFDTIRKNKLRTFLTGLSVSSGIFILVILLGFGQGMQNGIAEEFKEDAATSIWVWPRRTTIEYKGLNPGRRIQLRNENYETITNTMQDDFEKASMLFFPRNVQVVYNNDLLVYNVAGTNGNLQTIDNEFLSEGRYINEIDVQQNAKVVVLRNKIKREVVKDEESPNGEN